MLQVNVSLVAHYGPKRGAFLHLVEDMQAVLTASLGSRFEPYELGQVHGTIIGLEGEYRDGEVIGANFRALRGERRLLEVDKLIRLIAGSNALPMRVQVGGFVPAESYPFTSRGEHPAKRSFRIGGSLAVGMGWPVEGLGYPPLLYQLRRRLQRAGALHKYHGSLDATDNDFYFVLGRVTGESSDPAPILQAEADIRRMLTGCRPAVIGIGAADLSFVAYTDPALPPGGCRALSFADCLEQPRLLADLYSA